MRDTSASGSRYRSWLLQSKHMVPEFLSNSKLFDKSKSIVPGDETQRAGIWRTQWRQQQKQKPVKYPTISLPGVIAAFAVIGRCVVMPLLFLFTLFATSHRIRANFSLGLMNAYSPLDSVMKGGCTGCVSSCRKILMQLSAFGQDAIMSKPAYENLLVITTEEMAAKNFTRLTPAALELADYLDSRGAVCSTGVNEWGSPNIILAHDPEGLLAVIKALGLSVSPQLIREMEVAAEQKNNCVSRWAIGVVLRLFKYQNARNSLDYSSVSVADIVTFPHYTDCRPDIPNEGIIGAKLAFATQGTDLLAVVPDLLKLFPLTERATFVKCGQQHLEFPQDLLRLE